MFDTRFTPGTLLAGRYRVVGKLGKGGMGEVYRADDLKLGQAVALKFLPESFIHDPKWLRRFNDEVRIAREVAHPNVCRTYDVSESDGEHFITMEYVDGEDLSSLLRRIGRLPQDKAIEIARQLCAGLAAAHDKGVLHRDLKPANVMLDGRGRVRITDFGIAALAEEMHAKDARAGTPAYMAPEQLAGEAVTVRSDIYSLGLVLYEIFTGKEAFKAESISDLQKMRQSGSFTTPSTLVMELDPLVERVIMRCLEQDPRNRPGSAIAVAAALPGGDPLAMALAAGETPSPEMVAQAGDSGALKPGWAMTGLVAALAFALVACILKDKVHVWPLLPMDKPPDALLDRIRETERKLGYTKPHADWETAFSTESKVGDYLRDLPGKDDRFEPLNTGRLAWLKFWYRASPTPMAPYNERGEVWWDDPPFIETGMMFMAVDVQGRLLEFKALPLEYSDGAATSATSPEVTTPDWGILFDAANLDMASFVPTSPVWIPRVPFDTQAGWTGTYPEHPDIPIRIEAASLRGRIVWFNTYGPWDVAPAPDAVVTPTTISDNVGNILFPLLFMGIPVLAGALAWRNMRAGRGDRRGAWRFALYLALVDFCGWLFGGHHIQIWSQDEYLLVTRAIAMACFMGALGWVLYMAVEPYARRHWPQSIIAWTRLLSGRWRDPLVGRHVLLGAIAGGVAATLDMVPAVIAKWVNDPAYQPNASWPLQQTLRQAVSRLFTMQTSPTIFLGIFVILLMLRIMLKRQWLAVTLVMALLLFATVVPELEGKYGPNWFGVASGAGLSLVLMFSLVRLGLLATVVMMVTSLSCWGFPFTTDFSRWYSGVGLTGLLAFAAIAIYGFWISLAGQPLFKDDLDGPRARSR